MAAESRPASVYLRIKKKKCSKCKKWRRYELTRILKEIQLCPKEVCQLEIKYKKYSCKRKGIVRISNLKRSVKFLRKANKKSSKLVSSGAESDFNQLRFGIPKDGPIYELKDEDVYYVTENIAGEGIGLDIEVETEQDISEETNMAE